MCVNSCPQGGRCGCLGRSKGLVGEGGIGKVDRWWERGLGRWGGGADG